MRKLIEMIKPGVLRAGDKVAVVSPSWGGAEKFPYRYEAGKKELQEKFNVNVVEMPHALKSDEWLNENPKARADDLMAAFRDESVKAIIASIGGEDSVRLLPYIDFDVIRDNPKIFMGYSDTTVLHFACYKAGLTSFYGPSILAGFAENAGMHDYTYKSVQLNLCSDAPVGNVEPSPDWTCEFLDWASPENQRRKREMIKSGGWQNVSGQGRSSGHLLGGCFEVLEMIKGSSVWPTLDMWKGSILFIETSEEAPSVDLFRRCIRNYGTQGILQVLNGIIMGRPGGSLPIEELEKYDDVLYSVVVSELGLKNLPILSQLDFGHTDPMFVIPYGAQAEVDCDARALSILEAGCR